MSDTNKPTVIYEDEAVLVINKPVGWLTHTDDTGATPTVVDWFLARVPEARGVGEPLLGHQGQPLERSGVVHRLDRATSGVLILAKTRAAHAHLKRQFHDRLARKEYRALVYGHLREQWGSINRPIGRSAKDWRLRSATRGARGQKREAVTDWERLNQGTYQGEPFTYLKLKPKTGRMHQLRVHLKAINRPIVGDTLYAGATREQSNNLTLKRLALHAYSLELTLPNGRKRRFVSPVPKELTTVIEKLSPEL